MAEKRHYEAVRVLSDVLMCVVEAATPSEDDAPGAQSLMTYALLDCAAQLLARCPQPARGQAVDSYTEWFMKAVKHYGENRDRWIAEHEAKHAKVGG